MNYDNAKKEEDNQTHLEEPKAEPSDEMDAQVGIPIPPEILAQVPEEHRKTIVQAISTSAQISAPIVNPVFHKVTSEHITQIIENTEKDNARSFDTEKSQRWYQFIYFLVGVVTIAGLASLFTFTDNDELILPTITAVAGLAGGIGIGLFIRR